MISTKELVPIDIRYAPSLAMMPPGAPKAPYVAQTEENWCWAACGEMIMRPRGIPHSQCTLASAQFALNCCPSPVAPKSCNKGCWPDNSYPSAGVATTRVNTTLSPAQISAELAAGRQVQVCYQWTGSPSTHVALIVDEYPNGDYEVYDPWPGYGRGRRQLSQIHSAYGFGRWILSFTFQ